MSMDIYAKEGTRIRCSTLDGGYDHHKKVAERHLELNEVYTVDHTDVDNWHTDVYLKEFPGVAFNSVFFEDLDSTDAPQEVPQPTDPKDRLIQLLMNQVADLTMMSKIELGDDVIAEIKKLKAEIVPALLSSLAPIDIVLKDTLERGDVFLWRSGITGMYEIHTFHSDSGYGAKTFTNYDEKDGSSMLVNYSGIVGVIVPNNGNN